jgi:hypothetical protein
MSHWCPAWSSNLITGYIPKGNEANVKETFAFPRLLQRIHNSPKMKTTQLSIKWWMDKGNVVHIHNGMLF